MTDKSLNDNLPQSQNNLVLVGYEDMEISTRIILQEAIQRGIQFEILDRPANFIRLKKGNKQEFIKEASKTRLDSYLSFLIMENKTVSKLVLAEAGLRVPRGESFSDIQTAIQSYETFQGFRKVVKPVTTNFGIGIHILEASASQSEWETAVRSAFGHSDSILAEEFLPGPEYRFLVLGYQTVAVCNRVPANVTGDGVHTISELVDFKNSDPRRGEGHTTELEKIQKSPIETDVLRSQDLIWDSIPIQNQVVYLRKNSNISTGGDSIDCTDIVHPEYKRIAERAARSVEARICGVDIIAKNVSEAPNDSNHGILEINFNPVLYIHDYPYRGINRKVGAKVLDLLGF